MIREKHAEYYEFLDEDTLLPVGYTLRKPFPSPGEYGMVIGAGAIIVGLVIAATT